MNKVLMIAFHYPPYQGSSGVLRTLNFSRYLPDFGYTPLILTASTRVYGATLGDPKGLQVPANTLVWRAGAFDAARDLSIKGRYPRWFALPDRWSSWVLAAIPRGLQIIRQQRPKAIWSTYPIASAHLVALALHRLTGLPWIADFRDSMTEEGYPRDPIERKTYLWIERKAIANASLVVFTTPGTRRMYEQRYGQPAAEKYRVITNGYDEESFSRAEQRLGTKPAMSRPVTLLHSGVLYPVERDPRPFLNALARLKEQGELSADTIRVVLRASAHDATIAPMIEERKLQDIVTLKPPVPYEAALEELMRVDALLLFQAANCNHQIPAKLYEYLRSGRPVFALTDERGDTATMLKQAGVHTIADLADADDISSKLAVFIKMLDYGEAPVADPIFARSFSRRGQTGELAKLLTEMPRNQE